MSQGPGIPLQVRRKESTHSKGVRGITGRNQMLEVGPHCWYLSSIRELFTVEERLTPHQSWWTHQILRHVLASTMTRWPASEDIGGYRKLYFCGPKRFSGAVQIEYERHCSSSVCSWRSYRVPFSGSKVGNKWLWLLWENYQSATYSQASSTGFWPRSRDSCLTWTGHATHNSRAHKLQKGEGMSRCKGHHTAIMK